MRVRLVTAVALAGLVLVAACQPAKKAPRPSAQSCGAEGSGPTPALATTPPAPTLTGSVSVSGLTNPWDLAFTPDGTMIFTERTGRICALVNGVPITLTTLPDVVVGGEGGLLGLAIDPDFASTRFIYACFSSNASGGNDNRVARWTVDASYSSLSNRVDIITGMPHATFHDGCRPRFKPGTSHLWITTGDAGVGTNPQNVNSLGGKVLRVDRNGSPIAGNLSGRVLTRGHRNVQGLAFRANGEAYSVEHGPDIDDEVNLLAAGANYGWNPIPGYNQSVPMTASGATSAVWSSGSPTIAPSGATFVNGSQWEGWNGALILAVLKAQRLQVFVERGGNLDFGTPTVVPTGVRLRSAVQGPDGNLYIATDVGGGGGAIWKVVPT
jgi:glucose/arabinose dehydrogenase